MMITAYMSMDQLNIDAASLILLLIMLDIHIDLKHDVYKSHCQV